MDVSNDIVNYLERWVDPDTHSDYNLFFNRGYYELCAVRLIGAGAIDPIDDDSREVIRIAEQIDFDHEMKLIDQCLDENDYEIHVCPSCNAHQFVDTALGNEKYDCCGVQPIFHKQEVAS